MPSQRWWGNGASHSGLFFRKYRGAADLHPHSPPSQHLITFHWGDSSGWAKGPMAVVGWLAPAPAADAGGLAWPLPPAGREGGMGNHLRRRANINSLFSWGGCLAEAREASQAAHVCFWTNLYLGRQGQSTFFQPARLAEAGPQPQETPLLGRYTHRIFLFLSKRRLRTPLKP